MPLFKYKTLKENGESVESRTEAENQDVLKEELVAKGEQIVYIEKINQKSFWSVFVKYQDQLFGNIKEQEKIILARNLGSMIKAGLPLSKALSVVERQSRNKKLKLVVSAIQEDINKGHSFNEALANHPKVFSKLFI